MFKKLCSACVLVGTLASCGSAYEMAKSEGSSRVKGSVQVAKSKDTVEISMQCEVRKSGVSGTGKGVLELQLFNDRFELQSPIQVQKTVGADALRGTKTKSESKTVAIPADRYYGCVCGVAVSDSIGFPTSLSELEKFLRKRTGEMIDLKAIVGSLKSGQSKAIGDFTVIRF